MNEEFIAKLLAELFGFPCNFSPCEEELHNSEENCVWCEEHCNKCDEADCWMHYFEVKCDEQNRRKEQPTNKANGNQKSLGRLKGAKTVAR